MCRVKNPKDVAWFKKNEELKQFKIRKGHCNVPWGLKENPSLGRCVDNQRRKHSRLIQYKQSFMTKKIIRLLHLIGSSGV